jgi:hypothetical protein
MVGFPALAFWFFWGASFQEVYPWVARVGKIGWTVPEAKQTMGRRQADPMVFLFLEAVGFDLTAFLFWEPCAGVKSDLEQDCLLAPAGRNNG